MFLLIVVSQEGGSEQEFHRWLLASTPSGELPPAIVVHAENIWSGPTQQCLAFAAQLRLSDTAHLARIDVFAMATPPAHCDPLPRQPIVS